MERWTDSMGAVVGAGEGGVAVDASELSVPALVLVLVEFLLDDSVIAGL